MRSPRRRRAPSRGNRSPGPRCAGAARPALHSPAPSRGSGKAELANLSHQTPLKRHRQKVGIPRIHEPLPTELSRNPASHNGLTHEHGARNFAQLEQKRANNAAARTKRARRTRQPAPKGVQSPALGYRFVGQRLMLRGNGRRIVVAEASEAGLASWSGQIGAIHDSLSSSGAVPVILTARLSLYRPMRP
jgi:hypothetical protein